jgi:peptide deformylase
MIRPICKDIILLGKKSAKATAFDIPVANDLMDTLRANALSCVGMAANMIGVSKCIIAFQTDDGGYMEMFNPKIVSSFGEYETEETCLSLSGARKTKRCQIITVEYETRKMEKKKDTFVGFTAQIIQHEIDHTNGIII